MEKEGYYVLLELEWCMIELSKQYLLFYTVNQQILAAIKFGVSQNKVIWRLLNLASPPSMQCTINVIYVCWRDKYYRKHAIRQI